MLGQIVRGWANVTDSWLDHLFSGADSGLADLDKFMVGGIWTDAGMTIPNFSLSDVTQRILYGRLIPAAWSDHTEVHPVIVYDTNITEPNLTGRKDSKGLDRFMKRGDKVG